MTEMYHGSSVASDLCAAIGNTPLIRLKGASEETGCTILGKAEFMNPGGSVKDRAGLYIIRDAEARGVLKPGGTIVAGTDSGVGQPRDPQRPIVMRQVGGDRPFGSGDRVFGHVRSPNAERISSLGRVGGSSSRA